jgi:hypothetical protein
MSTKTTFKRIALVTVAALGFGVLTAVAPAFAAAPTPGVFTPTNTVTTLAGRIGQQVSVPLVGDLAVQAAGTTSAVAYLRIAAAMTSAPAAAASTYVSITAVTTGFATDGTAARLIYVGSHVTAAGTTAIATATTHAQDATRPATINYGTTATDAETDWSATTGTSLGTLTFTPTAAGTYSFTVWNETSVQTSAALLSGTEASQTFTVNVGASVASVTLAAVNSSAATIGATLTAGGSDGSLVKVSLKDAAGLASTLTSGESVTIQPSLSGKVAKVNGGATTGATAGGAYVLSSADFGTRGFAYVNITDTVAETVTLTATTGGWVLDAAGLPAASRITNVDGSGDAYFQILATGTGTIPFTVTSGTATYTFYLVVADQDAAAGRTVAITGATTGTANAAGVPMTATVKDRYGNPVKNVTLTVTASGVGAFMGGSTSQSFTTDKTGTFTFLATSYSAEGGSATFSVRATNATDSSAIAGYTATGVKVDSTLAAGVSSATATVTFAAGENASQAAATAAADAAAEATDAANAATDAANAAAEAADAATAAAQDAADAVAALATSVEAMVNALKRQITSLTNLVIKIQKKVRA